jgi:hypothetical protein
MEIMNETIGWGLITGQENKISVWKDWFNLLNRGFRVTGMGNSDNHTLLGMPVGWPRNYVAVKSDLPEETDAFEIAQSIIDRRVSVARGVFVDLVVNGSSRIGTEVADADGEVELSIHILAPSWVDVDRVKVYGNGTIVWEKDLEDVDGPMDLEMAVNLRPETDTWYLVRAEGDRSMWPVVPDQGELSVTPVGFTNPVWVDIDGGGFETIRDRARTFLEDLGKDEERFKRSIEGKDEWFLRQLLALVDEGTERESILTAAVKPFAPAEMEIPED